MALITPSTNLIGKTDLMKAEEETKQQMAQKSVIFEQAEADYSHN